MDFFGNIFHILGMNGAILLVPGVNFFLVAKYAITNGFRSSFQCVLGITAAIMLHVMFAAFSVGAFLSSHPMIFNLIRFGGGLFLLYLGTRFFISSVKSKSLELRQVCFFCRILYGLAEPICEYFLYQFILVNQIW